LSYRVVRDSVVCMNSQSQRKRPITRDAYAILVALSSGEMTGTEVQSQIVGDTVGVYVRDSSIYTVLRRFVEMGWVETKGKSYLITDEGRRHLKIETHKQRIVSAGYGRW
jgi:DNA-binding PadR family transcriptional regulator